MIPTPPEKIDRRYMQELVNAISAELVTVLHGDRDVVIRPGVRLVLVAPNGTKYRVKVDNSGVLSTEAI